MIMYKIVAENGMQGAKYYKSYLDAKHAAELRENISGMKWYVRPVVLK